MKINILDNESIMILVECQCPLMGANVEELLNSLGELKENGAMGFVFDLSETPYVGSGGIALLAVLGKEAKLGNDKLRLICPNRKFQNLFELNGLTKYTKYFGSQKAAIEDLKQILFVEELLPHPKLFRVLVDATNSPPEKEPAKEGTQEGEKEEKVISPPPASEAKPTEELPEEFEIKDVDPSSINYPYLLPEGKASEQALKVETKHISVILKDQYEVLSRKAGTIFDSTPEEKFSKRGYPLREWVRNFAIVQGKAPKMRHLLFSIGALVHKRAKTISVASNQALDQYDYEFYFALSVLEPCELYGNSIEVKLVDGWEYKLYSNRNKALANFALKLIDPVLEHVTAQKKESDDEEEKKKKKTESE